MIHPETIRADFPVFAHHPSLVYLDSAATSLKPRVVIDKEREYLEEYPANISRGLYELSNRATREYEETRKAVAEWIGALRTEVVFTKGTTEALNLLSYTLESILAKGDSIVVTGMDHHANFLPWQALALRTGAQFRVIPVSESGEISEEALQSHVDKTTKIFAFPFVSNVLGSISPVAKIATAVRALAPEARIILDAAQAAPHMPLDTTTLGVDFLALSAHKCFGPTGVGVLWGKEDILQSLSPFQYGGDMVESARIEGSLFKETPYRFEAGTPNISGVIAFHAAIDSMRSLDMEEIRKYEHALTKYAVETLQDNIPHIRILGPHQQENRSGIISFVLHDIHPHDLAESLAAEDVCIRAGAHCAHPLHALLNIPASARISLSVYNTQSDIDRAIESIQKAQHAYRSPHESTPFISSRLTKD